MGPRCISNNNNNVYFMSANKLAKAAIAREKKRNHIHRDSGEQCSLCCWHSVLTC